MPHREMRYCTHFGVCCQMPRRRLCGFHIVTLGWSSNCSTSNILSKKVQSRWATVVKRIQTWIYSWMNPGRVEDDDEYAIHKCLLITYICSSAVLKSAEGQVMLIVSVLKFLRGHVFVHEQQNLWYRRKHVLTMEVAHGSAHEVSCYRYLSHLSLHCMTISGILCG